MWWIDDYLDLNAEQKAWLMPRLHDDLDWHCRTELPRYVAWLDAQRGLVQRTPLQADQIESQFDALDRAMQAIAVRITPGSIELLRGLDSAQVAGLAERFDEDVRKWRREYLIPTPQEQIDKRSELMEKRLRPWFGTLSAAQRQRVADWAREANPRTPIWLANRRQQQQHLLTLLATRSAADFPQQLTLQLQQPESRWSEDYRQAYQASRRDLATLLADLVNSASAEQRTRLVEQFGELHDDLQSLDCQH
nr:DUF6279 family lipoprotein [Pseudomonas insulae]